MNLTTLQEFLDTAEIPVIEPKPLTFLEIAKQPHYENVLSNIYAFFFDVTQEHGFQDLFIRSLLELIKDALPDGVKEGLQNFSDFIIETEYSTKKEGRIDLLLHNEQQAIIIENKVYHILDNDLDDYWKSIKKTKKEEDQMIGVLLSLDYIPYSEYAKYQSASQYINITHLELINRVLINAGAYILNASDKYLVYLKDLVQNITNLSKSYMEQKDLDFYFNNQAAINQLAEFKFSVRRHIINEIEKAAKQLGTVDLVKPRSGSFNDNRVRYYASLNHPDLVIAVVFEDLMTDKHQMHIAVELKNSLLKDRSIYDELKEEFSRDENEIAYAHHFKTTNLKWSHFAVKHYAIDEVELTQLSKFILDKLERDHLLGVFKKLDRFLTYRKSKTQPL